MKMLPDDYKALRAMIENVADAARDEKARGYDQDLFMWDVIHYAWYRAGFNPTKLYLYLNDKHIETTAKRIFRELAI